MKIKNQKEPDKNKNFLNCSQNISKMPKNIKVTPNLFSLKKKDNTLINFNSHS